MFIIMNNKSFNIWIGLRGSDYQMFHQLTPINEVVSIDHDDTKHTPFISREYLTKERVSWENEELLKVTELSEFKDLLHVLKLKTETVNIYCYHSIPILEKLAAQYPHIHLHSAPIEIKRKLDDKLNFFRLLQQLNLNTIPSLEVDMAEIMHEKISKKLDTPYVIKLRVGASGGQTYMVKNREDFMKLKILLGKQTVVASKYIIGYSMNINGFINNDIHLTQPSFQLIGIPECSSGEFAYCGNDFGAFLALDPHIKGDIFATTKTIGNYMKKIGYYGVFGIDFIYDIKDKILYALEINPRMQGSTPLLTRYQTSKRMKTLIHLYSKNISLDQNSIPVSFILLHNISDTVKKIQTYYASGIYQYSFLGEKLSLKYIGNKNNFPNYKNEFLLLGCPTVGTTVAPGAGILRLEFSQRMLDKTLYRPQKKYSRIVLSIYHSLWNKK